MSVADYITSYNQRRYLSDSIESVLCQTLPPSQIIVVDDCSSDGSRQVIAGYASRHDRILPIFHAQNQGVARARNTALEAVSADYITYVDGDDRMLPQKLERELEVIRDHPSIGIVYSNYYQIRYDGERLGKWIKKKNPPQGDIFMQTFARDFPNGVLFRNELVNYHEWKRIGFYDPNLRIYEDYEMRIRLTKHLRAAYCDQPLSEYRRHDASLRSSNATQKAALFEYICDKNGSLLNDLPPPQRQYVERRLNQWRAHLFRMAAKEELGTWHDVSVDKGRAAALYRLSLTYQRYLDLDLILALLLPHGVYKPLRRAFRVLLTGDRS